MAQVALPTFTAPTLVQIEVGGETQAFKNYPEEERGQLFATIPATGYNIGVNCFGNVVVQYQYTNYWQSYGFGSCQGAAAPLYLLAYGQGVATRGWGLPGSTPPACGQYPQVPCYYYDGGASTITIAPVSAELVLTASASAVAAGDPVTFAGSATPSQFGNIDVPLSVTQWRWTSDGGASIDPCGTGQTCEYTPPASGTMKLTASVNHEIQTRTIRVNVGPPDGGSGAPGDPSWWNVLGSGTESDPVDPETEGEVARCPATYNGRPVQFAIDIHAYGMRNFVFETPYTKIPGSDASGPGRTWTAYYSFNLAISDVYEGDEVRWAAQGWFKALCYPIPDGFGLHAFVPVAMDPAHLSLWTIPL